jgi:hypothetical protein
MQSTPESRVHVGYDGAKRRKGSQTHVAVDTLGYWLTAFVTASDEQDRAQVAQVAGGVQVVTGDNVERAYVDQGYMGEDTAAAAHGIRLEVVKPPAAQRCFVLLLRRGVVEGSFGGLARFRRLTRDCEWLLDTVEGLTFVAFACVMLHQLVHVFSSSQPLLVVSAIEVSEPRCHMVGSIYRILLRPEQSSIYVVPKKDRATVGTTMTGRETRSWPLRDGWRGG